MDGSIGYTIVSILCVDFFRRQRLSVELSVRMMFNEYKDVTTCID
jgi:hypothetical protein